MPTWTLIDEQTPAQVDLPDDLSLTGPAGAAVLAGFGWERKPEGLCRDEVCVPLRDGDAFDLPTVARLIGRPLMVDGAERIAALAASPAERAETFHTGHAPDFELPDVNGVLHRLSDYQGRKIVLYAYASW